MSCCDGWNCEVEDGEVLGECPDCGEEVIVTAGDGVYAKQGCNYSPETCKTCGARPCDLSC